HLPNRRPGRYRSVHGKPLECAGSVHNTEANGVTLRSPTIRNVSGKQKLRSSGLRRVGHYGAVRKLDLRAPGSRPAERCKQSDLHTEPEEPAAPARDHRCV